MPPSPFPPKRRHSCELLLTTALLLCLSPPPRCCTGLLLLDGLTTTNVTATPSPAGVDDTPLQGDAEGIILPPGCSCRESGVADPSKCSSFDCTCPCDVTRGSCDWDCCCDVDCHVDQRSRFAECVDGEVGGSSSSASDSLQFCYQADTVLDLEKVNPKYPLRIEESAEDALNGLICVVDDNSQVKGNYYLDPGFPDADVAFSPNVPGGKRRYDYNSHLTTSSADAGTRQPNGSYERGDVIPTIRNVEGEERYVGLLRLPSPGDGGLCTVLNVVEFGVDVVDSDCVHSIVDSDISVQCEGGPFDVGDFVTNLYVGKRDDAGIAINDFVTVEWGSYHDGDGNELTPGINTTRWDESASVCLNALSNLRYEIVHDVSGSITAARAHVVTRNVGASDSTVKQTYGVRFVQAEQEEGDDDVDVEGGGDGEGGSNVIIPREKSGNPGYVMGRPTLAAKLSSPEDDRMYVNPQPEGLTVMDTGVAGFCSDTATGRTKVGFAEDKFVGCMLRLTRSELRDLCTSKTSPLLSNVTIGSGTMYLPAPLKIEKHHLVGIFGNADPHDRNQWLRIESPLDRPDTAIKERVWLPTTNVCEGLATRLTYRFLWTHVGNVKNPQAKIISAKVDFDHGTPLKHVSGPTEGQNFPFITTVTWTYAAPESSTPVKPPPPTLLFSVPDDVFYPFDVGTSSASKTPVSRILSLGVLVLLSSFRW